MNKRSRPPEILNNLEPGEWINWSVQIDKDTARQARQMNWPKWRKIDPSSTNWMRKK